MSIDTVTLTANSYWQDGTDFSGYMEITLQEAGETVDALVVPKRQQEIAFEDGVATVTLVPSTVLDGAGYRIRIITTSTESGYKSKTVLFDKTLVVPATDCELQDLEEWTEPVAQEGSQSGE